MDEEERPEEVQGLLPQLGICVFHLLNKGDLLDPKKTLGFEGDFAKGNAVKESRQNSEEVLGVEILSDTTLTRGVGILSTLTMSITEVDMLQKSFCLLIIC